MVLHTRIMYLFGFPDKSFIPVGHRIQRSWETADRDHSKSYWRLFSSERHDQNYVCDDKLPHIFLKVKLSVVQGIQAGGVWKRLIEQLGSSSSKNVVLSSY